MGVYHQGDVLRGWLASVRGGTGFFGGGDDIEERIFLIERGHPCLECHRKGKLKVDQL